MRIFLLLLAAASWWTFENHHSAPEESPAPLPPVSSTSSTSDAEGERWGVDSLWASADDEPAEETAEVVLCRVGEETSYLRLSDCASAGGSPSREPSWARVD